MKNKKENNRRTTTKAIPPLQFWKVKNYFLDADVMTGQVYEYKNQPHYGNGIGYGGEQNLYRIDEKQYPDLTKEDFDILYDNYFEFLKRLNLAVRDVLPNHIKENKLVENFIDRMKEGNFGNHFNNTKTQEA